MKKYDIRDSLSRLMLFIMAVSTVLLCAYISSNKNEIRILERESFFDTFYVKDNQVFIECYVTIQNRSHHDEYVKLSANLKADAKHGLLKSSVVPGFHKKGSDRFLIKANSKKEYNVVFIGEFAGNPVKQNRELPPIDLTVVR